MRKELLRIQNLQLSDPASEAFRYFSFSILEGEAVCILAPSWNGKTMLANLLTGKISFQGYAYFEEQPVAGSFKALADRGRIACISKDSQLFGELTIAENIFLNWRSSHSPLLPRKKLYQKAVEILSVLNLSIHPAKKANSLSPFEQHMVLLARALFCSPRLLVLDNPTYYYGQSECRRLASFLRGLQSQGISVLYLCSSADEISSVSDRMIVMNNTRKVRTYFKSENYTRQDLIQFFQKPSASAASSSADSAPPRTPLLTARHIYCRTLKDINLSLFYGKIAGIYDPDNHDGEILCRALSKESPLDSGALLFRQKPLSKIHPKRTVCYLPSSFAVSAIFHNLSVFENIYLFRKFSRALLTRGSKHFLRASIEKYLHFSPMKQKELAGVQNIYVRIKIVMFRFLLYHPQVLIFNMPFSNMDYQARQIIREFFQLYRKAGISVLFTAAQWEDLLELPDHLYILDGGNLRPLSK